MDQKVKRTPLEVGGATTLYFAVEGMTCASCSASVKSAIEKVEDVANADVNLISGSVAVHLKRRATPEREIAEAVQSAGYRARSMRSPYSYKDGRRSRKGEVDSLRNSAVVSLTIAAVIILVMNVQRAWNPFFLSAEVVIWAVFALTTPVILLAGRRIYVSAFVALRHGSVNMNTLISVAVISAYVYSVAVIFFQGALGNLVSASLYFDVSTAIIGFISLGRWLEERAKSEMGNALENLASVIIPSYIWILRNGQPQESLLDQVSTGELVLVKPGARVPVDGIVESGTSTVDESLITGESKLSDKSEGDKIYAGSMNSYGALEVRVEHVGDETVIGRIVRIVEQAQASKAPVERFADAVVVRFVPVVLGLAGTVFVIWMFFAPDPVLPIALLAAVSVLVSACPCALGIATPAAMVVAMGFSASRGILIRNAAALETAAKVDLVVFDKTGTLTEGRPILASMFTVPGIDKKSALALAAGLEMNSEHPLGKAVVEAASKQNIVPLLSSDFKTIPGRGAKAIVEGEIVVAGTRSLMLDEGVNSGQLAQWAQTLDARGETAMFVSRGSELVSAIGFTDTLKPGAYLAVSSLKDMLINSAMLTGDTVAAAAVSGRKASIPTVQAGMMPEDKAKWIEQARKDGSIVAMVGDGVNDAAGLTLADLSIAMESGADITVQSADAAIQGGNPAKVPQILFIGRSVMGTVKQNLFWGFIYNLLLLPIAAGALYLLFIDGSVPFILRPLLGENGFLNPAAAAAAMALSSLSVVLNSIRLRYRLQRKFGGSLSSSPTSTG